MSVAVTVQPEILKWARQRIGLDPHSLAQYLRLNNTSELNNWENTGNISLSKLEKIAQKAYVPIGYFFLNSPPKDDLPIQDFRRAFGTERKNASPELIDCINNIQFLKDWYEQKMIENMSDPLHFVGSVNLKSKPQDVANLIRSTLTIDGTTFHSNENWEESLRLFVKIVENAGILIMRSGIVGNNTHRKLDVAEFRGFTLVSNYSPIIFINSSDSKSAQMFTLAHELVHVWLGQSGVSNLTFDDNNHIEKFCNEVASEILVPNSLFEVEWQNNDNKLNEIKRIAKKYKVSSLVILIKALQNGFISTQTFDELYDQETACVGGNRKQSSGGDFYLTQGVRLSRNFISAVVLDTYEGKTTYVEAFKLLGIRKSATFKRMAELVTY